MTTSVNDVYSRFFDELENNTDFFNYYNLTEAEALQLAKERARSYLISACRYMRRRCNLTFTLGLTTVGEVEQFVEEITDDEIEILALIMTWIYFDRQSSKLLPMVNAVSAAELKLIHSPAAERDSYLFLVAAKEGQVNNALSDYEARDRLTFSHKSIEHALPEEEEE